MTKAIKTLRSARHKVANALDALHDLLKQLDKEISNVENLEAKLKSLEKEMTSRRKAVSTVVKFNMRGQIFETTKANLLNVADSRFFHILSSNVLKP